MDFAIVTGWAIMKTIFPLRSTVIEHSEDIIAVCTTISDPGTVPLSLGFWKYSVPMEFQYPTFDDHNPQSPRHSMKRPSSTVLLDQTTPTYEDHPATGGRPSVPAVSNAAPTHGTSPNYLTEDVLTSPAPDLSLDDKSTITSTFAPVTSSYTTHALQSVLQSPEALRDLQGKLDHILRTQEHNTKHLKENQAKLREIAELVQRNHNVVLQFLQQCLTELSGRRQRIGVPMQNDTFPAVPSLAGLCIQDEVVTFLAGLSANEENPDMSA
ncbi:hypothetical protein NUW54_g12209 [Trametes sanguinea]|uniref:Uncharacterized protein n=1 Tax=Trametes sanguinea TaxID=158606 RepID=A0ACC1N1B0_9APHY|nr:hypothetical protein NUW54_g12209 [Trametes sanguinea]